MPRSQALENLHQPVPVLLDRFALLCQRQRVQIESLGQPLVVVETAGRRFAGADLNFSNLDALAFSSQSWQRCQNTQPGEVDEFLLAFCALAFLSPLLSICLRPIRNRHPGSDRGAAKNSLCEFPRYEIRASGRDKGDVLHLAYARAGF